MGDESPDSSTEERIDRLESVVKQQNETIREMLPGRRAVIAGGAAAALGFGAGAGSASGQSAAGQVGTESEPVDVEAATVNAGSVNAENMASEQQYSEINLRSEQATNAKNTLDLDRLGNTFSEFGSIIPDGYTFPTLLKADNYLSNPIDSYYLAASEYQTDTIELFTAPDVTGPWTSYGPIITKEGDADQADAPHFLPVPEQNEIRCYFHEGGGSLATGVGGQYTLMATTPTNGDGTTWTKYGAPDVLLDSTESGRWDDNERTYLTVRRFGGWYLATYQGRDQEANEIGFGIAWSSDGKRWNKSKHPLAWGRVTPDYDPQTRQNHPPTLLNIGGEPVVLSDYLGEASDDPTRAVSLRSHSDIATINEAVAMFDASVNFVMGDVLSAPDENRYYLVSANKLGYFDMGDY